MDIRTLSKVPRTPAHWFIFGGARPIAPDGYLLPHEAIRRIGDDAEARRRVWTCFITATFKVGPLPSSATARSAAIDGCHKNFGISDIGGGTTMGAIGHS